MEEKVKSKAEKEVIDHAQLIDDIIARRIKPFYWIIGVPLAIMLTIFVSIALPVSSAVNDVSKELQIKANKDEVSRDYLRKGDYLLLQSQSHQADVEAIRNPHNADLIYNKDINDAGRTLDYVSRSGQMIQ